MNKDEELKALREKVAELESKETSSGVSNNYFNEMREIRKKGKSSVGRITYKDVHDHVNIPLYHTNGIQIGKIVGPVHPENAEQVFQRFSEIGIKLSIYKPTQEQIERYKATKEYKALELKFNNLRLLRMKSKKGSEIERLTKEIARLTGVPENQVVNIKQPDEVTNKR